MKDFYEWIMCRWLGIHSWETTNFISGIKHQKCRACNEWRTVGKI